MHASTQLKHFNWSERTPRTIKATVRDQSTIKMLAKTKFTEQSLQWKWKASNCDRSHQHKLPSHKTFYKLHVSTEFKHFNWSESTLRTIKTTVKDESSIKKLAKMESAEQKLQCKWKAYNFYRSCQHKLLTHKRAQLIQIASKQPNETFKSLERTIKIAAKY